MRRRRVGSKPRSAESGPGIHQGSTGDIQGGQPEGRFTRLSRLGPCVACPVSAPSLLLLCGSEIRLPSGFLAARGRGDHLSFFLLRLLGFAITTLLLLLEGCFGARTGGADRAGAGPRHTRRRRPLPLHRCKLPYSNLTPMRFSLRQMMRQRLLRWSFGTKRVNRSGM